jgi:PAS domain S-box-containing protein
MKRSVYLFYAVAIRLLLFPNPSPLQAASPNSGQHEPIVHSSYAGLGWTDSVMSGIQDALMQNKAIVWATAAVLLILSGLIALLVVAVVRRRRAEEALRQANLVVESSPVVLFRWIAAEGWPVALVSKNVIEFGYTPEELLTGTIPFSSLVHPEDLERVASEVQAYTASGVDQFHQQYRLVTKAGDVRWVEDHTVIEHSPDGQAVSYRGTVMDITEHKRAEEALQESERNFRDLAEKAVVGVYIIQDDVFKYVNARFAEIHGYSVAEMTGWIAADEAIFPEDRPVVAETVEKMIEGEIPSRQATFRILTKSGELRYVEDYSTITLYQGQPAMIGTAVDVTERKRAEEALRVSEERFRNLIESSPLPIIIAREGTFIYVNNAYCRMIGADSPDQMIHTDLLETIAPEKREEVRGYMAARARNEEAPVRYESVGIRRDGTRFPYEISVARVNLADGPTLIAYVNDITERKRVEEALEKRLVALTRPLGEGGEIAFEDLFNLADLQSLQDRFSEACGVASLITYPDGKPITRPTNFSSLCGEIIRKTPKGLRNCEHSDAMIGRYNPSGPIIQSCLSVGLRNAGASISLGGRHLANWLIGQVRDEAKSEEEIIAYAREIGADETAFLAAYRRIPAMSEERFEQIAQALFVLAHQLSNTAHQNVQQARFINERKSAEDTIRQNEAVLRSLLEATPAGVALLVDRVFQRVNPALCRITGYSEEEMIGMETRLLYPDEETYKRVGRELYEHMARTGMGVSETHLRRKDGAVIDVLLCLSPFDPTDADKGVTATVLDITELKRAEEETRRLRNFLSNIIDSMPSVLVGVDVNGCVTQWNTAAEKVTGVESKKAMGQLLDQVLPAMHRQLDRLRQAMRTRRVETETKVPRIVNGEMRYEDVTVYPLTSNGVEGAVIRVDDVTERVRIEEMIVQSEKMLSVGGLAAGMAHEINNPLGVILQAVQNLQRRVSPDLPVNIRVAEECGISLSSLQEYLERREILTFLDDIRHSGRRAAEIVTNMLNFSRKAEDGGTSTDLAELLDRTLTLAASDYDLKKHYDFRQIDIVREYDPETPKVICQSGKIQQVFLNVLRNGAEAMRTGGVTDQRPRFILRIFRDSAMVRVEIEDNGPGMNDAIRKRVFEPFFTTKPVGSGAGLGLSVSYFIVTEEHGGILEVESSPVAGTRFIIQLPVEGNKP